MSKFNAEKAITANSKGIIISFRDVNKHKFVEYQNSYVKNVQTFGTAKYQRKEIEQAFNDIQRSLYQKTIYGFSAYSPEELNTLTHKEKQEIIVRYTKVQRILNKLKQETLYKAVDDFLLSLFPKSKTIKSMTNVSGFLKEPVLEEEITFNQLGISKFAIANKLVEYSLLPKNFFNLA
jgi:hypothetical protein